MGIHHIEENLVRQNKALMLLSALLMEEFSRLTARNAQGVSQIEISIQELLRQMVSERHSLRAMVGRVVPGAQRVADLEGHVDAEHFSVLLELVARMDQTQQECGQQANKNHALAVALHDQSRELLEFMHNEIQPKQKDAYSARGRYVPPTQHGNILRGRL
ncbi:flagellar export chaperone FlgN [Salidesulfovibrio brasiliensis]|uniref:flagellar export chaperone FlgN n=1 Tax=Salidesulfovibrio brasiliensis TaxID=221711 RepID=UPI0006CFACEC|nr:flagellar export chaperone FlgN [Salidesulfovibrio brasiliensis]